MSFTYDLPDLRAVPAVEPLNFDAVVRRLTPRLQRYATRRLGGDRHEAEDLVQEALLRAYGHRAKFATEDDVAAWSTCVTGRLVIDRLRLRGRTTTVADVPEGTRVGRDTAELVVAREQAQLALAALDALAPRQAAVLWAREVEGLAYDTIGERFAMTRPAVRSVLSRARKNLRTEFATRGGTLPAAGLVALAPWIDGLTWIDRLRRTLSRAAAPATLGIAGLGLLSGALAIPWSPPAAAPGARPAVLVTETTQTATDARPQPATNNPAAAVRGVAGTPAARSAGARAPVGPAATTLTARSGLNDTCVGAAEAGAGGAGCTPAPERPALYLDQPLPDNPTGITYLGVESDQLACTALSAVPAMACTPTEGASR